MNEPIIQTPEDSRDFLREKLDSGEYWAFIVLDAVGSAVIKIVEDHHYPDGEDSWLLMLPPGALSPRQPFVALFLGAKAKLSREALAEIVKDSPANITPETLKTGDILVPVSGELTDLAIEIGQILTDWLYMRPELN